MKLYSIIISFLLLNPAFTAGGCSADSCIECETAGATVQCKKCFRKRLDSASPRACTLTIPSNCKIWDGSNNRCDACEDGYLLTNPNRDCVAVFAGTNCLRAFTQNPLVTPNPLTKTFQQCLVCGPGKKKDPNDNAICVNDPGQNLPNCDANELAGGVVVCAARECASGYTRNAQSTCQAIKSTSDPACEGDEEATGEAKCDRCNFKGGYFATNVVNGKQICLHATIAIKASGEAGNRGGGNFSDILGYIATLVLGFLGLINF